MRLKKLMRYLKKWQQAGLISEEQAKKIADYMHAELRTQFLRLIRVLFVIGAFWLFFGLIATLRLVDIEMLKAIGRFFYNLLKPVIQLAKIISPKHYRELLSGISCLLGWGLFHRFGIRLKKKSDTATTELGFLQEKELRLGTTSFTLGYILASCAWAFFNQMIYPPNAYEYWGKGLVFPAFSLVGMIFFFTIAYLMQDQIALLFGIGSLAHAIGVFTAYYFATYVIGVSEPVIQFLIGVLFLFVGLWHIEKVRGREDDYRFMFGRTYEWTGMLFIYLSLWIMSILGIAAKGEAWTAPTAVELWVANILFIAASLGAMFYGAAKEDRMFFNFGLTFFIIESYTLFFSMLWATVGTAIGSLLLGIMLIATGYALRRLWLQGRIFKKPS